MSEVYLAIYDLSHGMARSLSAQFLGPNHVLDLIPHTGIVVFGKEYFFGSGIQAVEPSLFRRSSGMQPIQTKSLGRTSVSQQDFDTWCFQTAQSKFNARTYDLLHRNCNHFSHDAAQQGLKLTQGVPAWILTVPQQFLASPMGQFVRPILEQQQQQFLAATGVGTTVNTTTTHTTGTTSDSMLMLPSSTAAMVTTSAQANPWADMSSNKQDTIITPTTSKTQEANASSSPTTTTTTTTTSLTAQPPSSSSPCINNNWEILSKYTSPMISNDTQSLPICVSKLKAHIPDERSQQGLHDLQTCIEEANKGGGSISSNSVEEDDNNASLENGYSSCTLALHELWSCIEHGRSMSFALLFLRLIVLPNVVLPTTDDQVALGDVLNKLMEALEATPESSSMFPTPAGRSLAWCVMSNYSSDGTSTIPSALVEAAMRDSNHPAVPVRQAACTFLYNYVLVHADVLDQDEDTLVCLICSSLETLLDETDPTTRLRRLLVVARVVFRGSSSNDMAKDLVRELGIGSLLQELSTMEYDPSSDAHSDAKNCRKLALELWNEF